MRPLTEEETKTVFLKLSEYIGKNIERMINRSDERHCFRLIKVQYARTSCTELVRFYWMFSRQLICKPIKLPFKNSAGQMLLHQ